MVLLGLQAGNVQDILRPGATGTFVHAIRAALPFVAAYLGVVIILVRIARQRSGHFPFFGPLGFATVYGLVGVAASFLSPNPTVALYWAAAYLSVPLVLWAIAWGPDALGRISRLVYFNWLIIFLAVLALFAWALLYRDLGSIVLNPSSFSECPLRGLWYGQTLRSTGVGRYAAISAIIALGLLWQPRWRFLSGFILLASLILLVSSGARGAIIAFAVAAPLVFLLSAGKKTAAAGALALVILVPLVWSTGIHNEFLDRCIFRGNWTGLPQVAASEPLLHQQAAVFLLPGWLKAPASGSVLTREKLLPNEPVASVAPEEFPRTRVSDVFVSLGNISFTGRRAVWTEALDLFKESPVLGYGFHADRLLLGTHLHNAFLHALLQTGLIGTIAFLAAMLFGWYLFIRAVLIRARLPAVHKHLVIQVGGIMAFLTVRSIPESSGAFFGVDWLLLAPILLYLQFVNQIPPEEATPT